MPSNSQRPRGAGARRRGGKGAGKGGKGAKSLAAPPKQKAKASTKLLSLQHQRPGEKPKGVKGWMRDLDARGWSAKKTALAAGLEAWFEAYAEAYTGVRLAKQIAPWKWKRDHEVLRAYCQWWWTYAKALRSRGGISAGVAGRLAFLEHAAFLFEKWKLMARFRKALPAKLIAMPYGRLMAKALREWRENLLDSTPRRKAALRLLMQRAAEHHRTRVALPNALLDWRYEAEQRAARRGVVDRFNRWLLQRDLQLWSEAAALRKNANAYLLLPAQQLALYQQRGAFGFWRADAQWRTGLLKVGKLMADTKLRVNLYEWKGNADARAAWNIPIDGAVAQLAKSAKKRAHDKWSAFVAREKQLLSPEAGAHELVRLRARRSLRLWGGAAHADAVLKNLGRSRAQRQVHDFVLFWHRFAERQKIVGRIAEHVTELRLGAGFRGFTDWRAERTRVKQVSARTIRRNQRAQRFSRWATIARARSMMQLAKDEARRVRRARGLRGFKRHADEKVRALTPQDQNRLKRLRKLRVVRRWQYVAAGRALLGPARNHYRAVRLGDALRRWDEQVIHGKKLKERRMGLAAHAHWKHRSQLAAFTRLAIVAERRLIVRNIVDRMSRDRLKQGMLQWVIRWTQHMGIYARRQKALLLGRRALLISRVAAWRVLAERRVLARSIRARVVAHIRRSRGGVLRRWYEICRTRKVRRAAGDDRPALEDGAAQTRHTEVAGALPLAGGQAAPALHQASCRHHVGARGVA